MPLVRKPKFSHFDKYYYYTDSVQTPELDVAFMKRVYNELNDCEPRVFREDFCGTFANCCEWVKLGDEFVAHGVDLDAEPLSYGRQHYYSKLKEKQQSRLHVHEANVLQASLPRADLVCALNFSYFIFKTRSELKAYFQNAFNTLNEKGVFVCDCFGGSECYETNEEVTWSNDGTYRYFWDQAHYDPLRNHAIFHIHFKRKGEKKREKVFTYDWRMWSIPEVRDILEEVGFSETHVYWEGTDENGEGDGNFERVEKGEECESWISYITAKK